jgi:hypothetical protein
MTAALAGRRDLAARVPYPTSAIYCAAYDDDEIGEVTAITGLAPRRRTAP